MTREMSRSFNLACEQLRMVGLSTSVPERLARLLLVWSDEPGSEAGACQRTAACRMTHEEIGEFIGASRETVTRTLSIFKNRHLVAQHGCTLTIPSRSGSRKLRARIEFVTSLFRGSKIHHWAD